MAKLIAEIPATELAKIARDLTVAAINNPSLGFGNASRGEMGTAIGSVFASAFKLVANAEA